MKKDYFANIDYNKSKRRNSLILSILLTICILATASLFAIKKDYMFTIIFAVFLLIPILSVPSTFKIHPLHNKPILTITDKEIIINGESVKIKDIIKISCIIELPNSKLDSENKKLLQEMRTAKPENIFYGSFDVVTLDSSNKNKTLYSHIEQVIDAIEESIKVGVKRCELRYTIKKNSVLCEYDFKKGIEKEQQKEFQSTSKKSKTKQLV